jgi:hypothetical protein
VIAGQHDGAVAFADGASFSPQHFSLTACTAAGLPAADSQQHVSPPQSESQQEQASLQLVPQAQRSPQPQRSPQQQFAVVAFVSPAPRALITAATANVPNTPSTLFGCGATGACARQK